MSDDNRLRFYFAWVGSKRCRLVAKMGQHRYAQDFDQTTPLGDALDIVRGVLIRRASGLDEALADQKDKQPQQREIL